MKVIKITNYYIILVLLALVEKVYLQAIGTIASKTCAASAGAEIRDEYRHFQVAHEWKYLDFEYPTYKSRQLAISQKDFIPENNVPLGIDVHHSRLFITTPRWKDGVPATLNKIAYPSSELSPSLQPYPHWSAHSSIVNPDCSKFISVYRTFIDECERLWVIDAGAINPSTNLTQICPPKIVVYDLRNDQQLLQYEFPANQVKQDSLHSNIVVELVNNQCQDAYAYVTDTWRYGLTVYSMAKGRSWRITSSQFLPLPQATNFQLYGVNFSWFDGIFGISLSPITTNSNERFLFFHAMAGYKEYIIATSLLRNETLWTSNSVNTEPFFQAIGDRGAKSQSSSSAISRDGVMLFTQVHRDSIACWDSNKPYQRSNIVNLRDLGYSDRDRANLNEDYAADNGNRLIFPNDLKIRFNWRKEESVWVVSNRLPIYLYSQLDFSKINFRILTSSLTNLISNTVCDRKAIFNKTLTLSTKTVTEGECY